MTEPTSQEHVTNSVLDPSHPFVATKPPATDQLTYLTLLECNLTKENVEILQKLLQDDSRAGGTLVAEIGWDLVLMLLPLVEVDVAKECMVDIARLGNPRECALKVEQGLRTIHWVSQDGENDNIAGEYREETVVENQQAVHPAFRKATEESHGTVSAEANGHISAEAKEADKSLKEPLAVAQYEMLVRMLGVLHSRIMTKRPSRFMATTLAAVLAAISNAPSQYQQTCMDSAIKLVRTLMVGQRPVLPPRTGSSTGKEVSDTTPRTGPESDDESQKRIQEQPDSLIQRKLLQSFVTHVIELWVCSLDSVILDDPDADVPALAWSSQFHEHKQPQLIVPGRKTYRKRFEEVDNLRARSGYFEKLVRLATIVGLRSDLVAETALRVESESTPTQDEAEAKVSTEAQEDDEPPEKPEDVPLSLLGSLILFAGSKFATTMSDTESEKLPSTTKPTQLRIFPEVAKIINNVVGAPGDVVASTAAYPTGLLDAILFLVLLALSHDAVGDPSEAFPEDRDAFPRFLQTTSLISANSQNSSIRYCAHVVTATVLRSHPEPAARLGFIRDTLEYAPLDSLKAEAVGWLKGEIIEANMAVEANPEDHEESIFTTSLALDSVSMHLYPDLQTLVPTIVNSSSDSASAPDPVAIFSQAIRPKMTFLLAVLNFHYLLLKLPASIRERLDVLGVHKEADVATGFLAPLKEAAKKAEQTLSNQVTPAHDHSQQELRAEVMLLQQAIEQVEKQVILVVKEST